MISSMKKSFSCCAWFFSSKPGNKWKKTSSAIPSSRNELWVVNKSNFFLAWFAWKSRKWLNSPSFLFLVPPTTKLDKLSGNTLRCCRRCLLSIPFPSHNVSGWWWSLHCDSLNLDNIEKVNYIKSSCVSQLQLKTHFEIFTRQDVKLYEIFSALELIESQLKRWWDDVAPTAAVSNETSATPSSSQLSFLLLCSQHSS